MGAWLTHTRRGSGARVTQGLFEETHHPRVEGLVEANPIKALAVIADPRHGLHTRAITWRDKGKMRRARYDKIRFIAENRGDLENDCVT
ncbi:hypothetical protein [Burkholderia pseudomallei]|uniref:hypothetical protein n=1 Tax=Burkholderia pseudomallei TaxID=28450 RepID=UPI0012B2CE95|nr:hypothetical protein [Burkholderia pseudomallei]QRM26075.1 hypothetical protein JQX71_20415 [Burkholderia pseudomallei]